MTPSLRILAGLFIAPLAWMVQISLSAALASNACYPHATPLQIPHWHDIVPMLAVVSLACIVISAISWTVSWRALPQRDKTVAETGEERVRFFAMLSFLSNSLFLATTLFTACAILLVSPCHPWF